MSIVALILVTLYALFFLYTLAEVVKGRPQSILYYVVIFYPLYTVFLTINYDLFESSLLIKIFQYSKEIIVFTAFGMIFISGGNFLQKQWTISFLDKLFLAFIFLTLIFYALGIGEATLLNRSLYLKNILVMAIFYFFGRNIKLSFKEWNKAFQMIFVMAVIATIIVCFEKVLNTHIHQFTGFAKYHLAIKDQEPTGIYGLSWTFEAEGGRPRYSSYFAHPLELASAMLVVGSAGFIYLISTPLYKHKKNYLFLLFCTLISLLFAYSRASFVSYILMFIFMALLMKYYKVIFTTVLGFVLLLLYIFTLASDDIRYFVIDTITFTNSSSLTHLTDWGNAVVSIIDSPMGIGLAMSGNASGVEQELMVGGENQFLIFGVQLGVLGMLIYIAMLGYGIRHAWLAFRRAKDREKQIVPFVAAATKFGLLLPLFTANAEVYIYISLLSWWMIGYSESLYLETKPMHYYRLRTLPKSGTA